MKRIGNMIIGVSNKGRNNQEGKKSYTYLTSIINGDIDADKLDYIKRDSYTSGLPLTFDIERLLYKITIKEHGTSGDYQLVVDMAGITAVEEITFSKLMLNNYIYHHHKVLATEVMAKDIGLALMELGYINHPCDFYNYTDKKIEALIDSDERPFISYGDNISLGYLVKRVKDRYLPKRCFEINSRVLEALPLDKKQEKEQEKDYVKNCLNEIEKANSFEEKEVALLSFAASKFEFSNKNENQISQFQKFISEFGITNILNGLEKTFIKKFVSYILKQVLNHRRMV